MPSKRTRSERVTLLDVANTLGVSAITVSRALRDPEKVSEPLRLRILEQVEDMGYVPDLAARALASRHSGIIGVLAPSLTNHAFLGVMDGIEERVRATDFRIQYANSHYDPDEEYRQVKHFLSQHPAGVLLTVLQQGRRVADLLEKARCPIVQIIDVRMTPVVGFAVGIDHREASAAATRHLLDCGYRRVGLLGGSRNVRAERRHEGYRAMLEENGLYDPRRTVSLHAPIGVELGCRLFRLLLETAPEVDAVLCQSDELALGALFECRRLGINVPEDFGICGYGDLEFSAYAEPGLTTIRVPRFDIGYHAADLLVGAADSGLVENEVLEMPFELMRRGSTRAVG